MPSSRAWEAQRRRLTEVLDPAQALLTLGPIERRTANRLPVRETNFVGRAVDDSYLAIAFFRRSDNGAVRRRRSACKRELRDRGNQ